MLYYVSLAAELIKCRNSTAGLQKNLTTNCFKENIIRCW